MFVLPFQNEAKEFFATEIASCHAFIFEQPFLDCRLRANSSVIHPRQPHHFPPLHPPMPRQNILDGSVKDMTKSENASDVWGRYNNRERRLRRFGVGMKCVCVEPARILMAEDAKLIVVACNTVSSVAIPKLRAGVSVPVIGVIEPGAHAAIAMTRNRHVGVIGTRATIRSGAYENALRALNVHVRVSSVACPLLVPLIEEGLLDDKLTDLTIERYLNPMMAAEIDTLVLGCTHYPLLTRAIVRSLGDKIQIVDSAMNCARAVKDLLDRQSLTTTSTSAGKLDVALTDT